ncbi:hypothetical protein SMACR_08730 [Sordaria macrospora]|uniref:WGS project CABT00000000 data, contig 2.64 n=2 Tax=Sordaria macrospora TaxID=5147 RepID=F7WAQ3_SORMK|nr:uncharacterized protein SMAC_08730 [Sordaria macrospora k-hell]KAA8635044.1 hypothetical protein SMACR_08730 [Sordaria macrospora]WPJ66137.1 hypothetical protein SMAC4_08730 [Sordaria macrospora]CCC05362.1 unnamed protein product [Sordaria macrospora k-hell]
MMAATVIFLTGEEMDVAACTTFDKRLLSKSGPDSPSIAGLRGKERCRSWHLCLSALRLPFGGLFGEIGDAEGEAQRCHLLQRLLEYLLGKKPEPKLIYVAGYLLPYPITPENPDRAVLVSVCKGNSLRAPANSPTPTTYNNFNPNKALKSGIRASARAEKHDPQRLWRQPVPGNGEGRLLQKYKAR